MDERVSEPSTSQVEHNKHNFECLLVQYKTLVSGGFAGVARTLEKELNSLGIVPPRYDIFGVEHEQTLREYLSTRPLSVVPALSELAGAGGSTLLSTVRQMSINLSGTKSSGSRTGSRMGFVKGGSHRKTANFLRLSTSRELGAVISPLQVHTPNLLQQSMERHSRVTGHIDRTYTVNFDRSGRFALTAADDCTIKAWDVNSAMLRYTFRGHFNLISDMCVSYCNQFMASGGADKHIRVWSLQTGATVEVFRFHTALVTGLMFLPYVYGSKRFLCSYGYDCNVIFYEFDEKEATFNPVPTIFNIRDTPGIRCVSSTFSPSGRWVAIGDTQGTVRLFRFENGVVTRDEQFRAIPHQERLDSLEWSHKSVAFVTTSSRSHIGRLWRFVNGEWRCLEFQPKQPDEEFMAMFASTKLKYGVCMVCWTNDDKNIVVSGTDFRIRIYDSESGKEKHRLTGHKAEAFHLKPHPIHPNIVFSSAHDGLLMIWDVECGQLLRKFTSEVQDGQVLVVAAILDLAITPDGTRVATVDDLGRLTIYGLGSNDAHLVPREQFFLDDYEPLEMDESGFGLDMATGLAPHLMPPPMLVNIEKEFLENKWQHKVPGKERDLTNVTCPWLNRSVIPKLSPQSLISWREEKLSIRDLEDAAFAQASQKRGDTSFSHFRPVSPDLIASPSRGSGRARPASSRSAPRQRTALPSLQDVIAAQDARRATMAMEGYRSEDDASYSGSSSSDQESENAEGTSDSDYCAGDEPRVRREPLENGESSEVITTSSGRRVHRRVLDGESVSTASTSQSTQRVRRKRQVGDVSAAEEERENSEDAAGTSAVNTAETTGNTLRRKMKKDESLNSFPDMMRCTRRRRFPYIAQLGDRVVYCKQGHARYIEQVDSMKLYPISNRMRPRPELCAEEFCVVEEVKYIRKPYRLTVIRLAQEDRQGHKTGLAFTVKLHDLANSPDFLLLRYHYDLSIAYHMREGDEIESILDGHWWTGTVTRRQPRDEDHPMSNWICLMIRWDNGEDDIVSPWDCQPKAPGRKSTVVATEADEVQFGDYPPVEGDWPGSDTPAANKESCCRRLIAGINQLVLITTVKPFSTPVCLADFPHYAACVDYCIDLDTVCERLQNRMYRRMLSVQQDIRFIALAAEQFNEPSSVIVHNSRILVETLIRFSEDQTMTESEITSLYESLLFELPVEEIQEYRRPQRPRLSIDPAVVEMIATAEKRGDRTQPGWVVETGAVIDSIMQHPSAIHFSSPESTTNQEVREVLIANGGLRSIRDSLASFSDPADVLERIHSLMEICKEAIDDNQSRLHDSAIQVYRLASDRINPISQEYQRIVNTVALLGGRELRRRQRHERRNAYNTRSSGAPRFSARQEGTSRDRHAGVGEDVSSTSTTVLRSLRKKSMTGHTNSDIENAPCSSRLLAQSSSDESGYSKQAEAPKTTGQPSSTGAAHTSGVALGNVRRNQAQVPKQPLNVVEDSKKQHQTSVRLLQQSAASHSNTPEQSSSREGSYEESVNGKCRQARYSTRSRKRQRVISESSGDDDMKEEDVATSQRSVRRTTRSTRNYQEDSEEDYPKESVSQRGRVRRIRKFS